MSVTGFNISVRLLLATGLTALCFHPVAVRAATTTTRLVESKLGGDTILTASAPKLVSTVRDCVKSNPARPGSIVQVVLGSGRADADALSPQVTVAAIEGLGNYPLSANVGEIVYFAVKATPAVVLEIVRAAVKADPPAAKAIVRAAFKAVPNPQDKIKPVGEQLASNQSPPSDTGFSKDDPKDAPPSDDLEPIGEAIAKAAMQGDPGLSYQDLMDAINHAGTPFTTTSTYQGYYYPPIVYAQPSPTPTPTPGPVPTPSPPVVSK